MFTNCAKDTSSAHSGLSKATISKSILRTLQIVWKNIVARCKVWLGAKELLIKDQIFRNCPMEYFGYLNMLPVVKLPVNSHALISLYQPYSHTCWILENIITVYTKSDMLTCVTDLRHH